MPIVSIPHPPSHSPKPDGIVRLPIGQPISIFCHFANQSPEPLTLTWLSGSLNMNTQFEYYLQNFTSAILGHVVAPGKDVTIEYSFTVSV